MFHVSCHFGLQRLILFCVCMGGGGGGGGDAEGRGARRKGRREGLCGAFQQDPSQI